MKNLNNLKWSKEDQKDWISTIKKYYNIEYLNTFNTLQLNKILFATGCSATKSGKETGIPAEMYWGQKNLNFYKMMSRFDLDYGVCSDFLGIVFKDEIFNNYDVHPSEINDQIKQDLGKIISEKVQKRGYSSILFFNNSPLQSRPYFEMLYYSGLQIFFFTKLEVVSNYFSQDEELDLFE